MKIGSPVWAMCKPKKVTLKKDKKETKNEHQRYISRVRGG
jgi:hypothetical protein